MSDLLLSIVTPSYNQGLYLETAIRSVLEQDYPRIEYMVVDGGSTDGSLDIIRRYSGDLAWWVSEPDQGQSHAINKGWQRASGRVLAWLNADDYYLPGAVRRVVEAFEQDEGGALVFGNCLLLDQATGRTRLMDAQPAGLVEVLLRRALIPQPAAFARAESVRAVGGLDERLKLSMDFDLWLRLLQAGPAKFLPGEPLACYRSHASAKSSSQATAFARELIEVLDRFYARAAVPAQALQVRRGAYAQACLVGARASLGASRDVGQAVRWLLRAIVLDPWVGLAAVYARAKRCHRQPERGLGE